jgi:amino acid adenylation domain-containing protein
VDLTAGRGLVRRWRADMRPGQTDGAAPPLSPTQRGLLFFERLHPGSAIHNAWFAGRHTGPLDRGRLDAAVTAVVRRHPALRTTFRTDVHEPVQEVHDDMPVSAQWTDLRDWPATDREATARRLAADAVAAPFDLADGPLVRLNVYLLADDEQQVVLAGHHLVCDGGSLRVVLDELDTAYRDGELPGKAPTHCPVSADPDALAYWRSRLAGLPDFDLPSDRVRPAQPTFRGRTVPLTVPEDVVAAAERLCRDENVTLFTVVLAAFQLLMGRHSGQTDFAVGTAEAGRASRGVRDVVGSLAKPIVLRADLSGAPSFRELVRRARATCLAAFAHRDVPFEDLVAELARGSATGPAPLFQAYLVFHNERGEPRLAGSALEPVILQRAALRHDVELHLWREHGMLAGYWDYGLDAVDETTGTRMAERFGILLAAAVADPDAPAGTLDIHTAEDRTLLDRWIDVRAPAEPPTVLPALFAEQAARTPDAIAVTDGRRDLTYRQLDARSNQLGHHLRAQGTGPGDVVGIRMSRTVDLAVATLGIMKSGAAYLPLDPAYPAERLEFMLADTGAHLVVGDLATVDGLDEQPECAVDGVDVRPDDLAYVLYTSGSTGRPKGVMLTHANAVALVRWGLSEYTAEQLSRVLASTSICFDVSIAEFFVTLCAGGTVVVVDDSLALLSPEPPDVTLANIVPTVARELIAAGVTLNGLRVVNLAGEAVPAGLVDDLYAIGSFELVSNAYGPTEDTTYSTTARLRPGEQPLPIGQPLPYERAYVLDESLRLVPFGAVGELYLAGAGLARGYRNRRSLTASRFVADPISSVPGQRMYRTGDLVRFRADGALTYLGRQDFQVKVRGQRIELGEIETTLQHHPAVRDAVVVAHDNRLVGYLTAEQEGQDVDVDDVRAFVRRRLPEVMVPSAFVVLDALPRTPNGKADRRALPIPAAPSSGAGERPRGAAEELVAAVWREVLELDTVGRDDNFFDLGGDSLLANRVLARLRERAGVEVPLLALFEQPQLAGLAAALPAERPAADVSGERAEAPYSGPWS